MIRRCDLVAVLICIFYYCNAHLIIFTCNLRTISIKLLLLLLLLLLIFSQDIRMPFGLDKCVVLEMRRGRQ